MNSGYGSRKNIGHYSFVIFGLFLLLFSIKYTNGKTTNIKTATEIKNSAAIASDQKSDSANQKIFETKLKNNLASVNINTDAIKNKMAMVKIPPPSSSSSREKQFVPKIKGHAAKLEISAISYLSAFIGNSGKSSILIEKNSEDRLPIASITKLMTAIIADKFIDPEKEIAISKKIVNSADSSKRFKAGDIFKAKDLLAAMLVESNNDAALALADTAGESDFINLMNGEAKTLGMLRTNFSNPVGLDPDAKIEIINHSAARDLLILAQNIIKNYPAILKASSSAKYDVYSASEMFNHTAIATNKLLESNDLACGQKQLKILGGKTGFTNAAKRNLFLITSGPAEEGYLVSTVLGSENNFEDMKKLIAWTCESYDWQENLPAN